MQQQKKKSVKDLFSFPGQKMLLRENWRLDRNMKLLEILPYMLTHIGTYGSFWNSSQNFKDSVKELRERWVKNEKRQEIEKIVEMSYRNYVKLEIPVPMKSCEKTWKKVGKEK